VRRAFVPITDGLREPDACAVQPCAAAIQHNGPARSSIGEFSCLLTGKTTSDRSSTAADQMGHLFFELTMRAPFSLRIWPALPTGCRLRLDKVGCVAQVWTKRGPRRLALSGGWARRAKRDI